MRKGQHVRRHKRTSQKGKSFYAGRSISSLLVHKKIPIDFVMLRRAEGPFDTREAAVGRLKQMGYKEQVVYLRHGKDYNIEVRNNPTDKYPDLVFDNMSQVRAAIRPDIKMVLE